MYLTFDLKSFNYYSYRKPSKELLYIPSRIHNLSVINPQLSNEIPSVIRNQISKKSCLKNHLDNAASDNNIVLAKR